MKAVYPLALALALAVGPALPNLAPAEAGDLGTYGEVWPIAEPDLLSTIKARLERAAASGELDRLNAGFAARAKAKIMRPDPVAGVGPALEDRSWDYDPSIAIDRDIADLKGNVIARAGRRVNPLDSVSLPRALVFIDGDDPAELEWGLAQGGDAKAAIILVKGSPFEVMKQRKRRVYFDQEGRLTARFGIRATPARVRQQGRVLEVREVALKRRGS